MKEKNKGRLIMFTPAEAQQTRLLYFEAAYFKEFDARVLAVKKLNGQ